jgi:hypothetical protein
MWHTHHVDELHDISCDTSWDTNIGVIFFAATGATAWTVGFGKTGGDLPGLDTPSGEDSCV